MTETTHEVVPIRMALDVFSAFGQACTLGHPMQVILRCLSRTGTTGLGMPTLEPSTEKNPFV